MTTHAKPETSATCDVTTVATDGVWRCTRQAGHPGPCAAVRVAHDAAPPLPRVKGAPPWSVEQMQQRLIDAGHDGMTAAFMLRMRLMASRNAKVLVDREYVRATLDALDEMLAAYRQVRDDLDSERNRRVTAQEALTRLSLSVEGTQGEQSATDLDGAALIAAERRRHTTAEGYDAAHDDAHALGELARAGAAYAMSAAGSHIAYDLWPWNNAWRPDPEDPVRDLVKAGALIAAEIDRLQRLRRKDGGQ